MPPKQQPKPASCDKCKKPLNKCGCAKATKGAFDMAAIMKGKN